MNPTKLRYISALILLSWMLPAWANDLIDISVEQNLQEREIKSQIETQTTNQSVFATDKTTAKPNGYVFEKETPCFEIHRVQVFVEDEQTPKKFQFLSNELNYGNHKIAGKCLGKNGLRETLEYAQILLVDNGYITSRIIAQPQELTTGYLKLTVIPGVINKIYHATNMDRSLNTHNALNITEGDVLSLRDIESSLENLRLSDGYTSTIDVRPIINENSNSTTNNPNYGYSDIVIEKSLNQKVNFGLSIDDSGSQSTGKYQGTVNLQINEPLQSSDVFYLSYLHSIDPWNDTDLPASNYNFFVSYQYPYKQWLFNASFNDYRYDQTLAGLNYDPVYQGISKTTEVKLARNLHRTANSKLSGFAAVQRRHASNFIDDLEVLVQRRQTTFYDVGLAYEHYLNQGQTIKAEVAYRQGSGAFDAKPIPETYFSDVATRPSIWSADIQYQTPFVWQAQNMGYRVDLAAQHSPHTLSSQDRFAIGSRNTVRGFDGGYMLSGESGISVRNELNWQLPFLPLSNQLYLGLDQGWVGGQSTKYLSGRTLTGTVIGMRLYDKGFYLDGFVGKGLVAPKSMTKETTTGFRISTNF